LADNALEPKRESKKSSKIYKVQSFIEISRRTFQKNYNFGRYGTIDESVIKFKARSSLKQYLPLKPIKRGYKVWCLCDSVTGYLFNYEIYTGKEEDSEKGILLTERVVFNLISDHSFQGKHLYFDNYFTSIGLLEKLKLQNIKAAGTIRPDRAGIPSDFVKKIKWNEEISKQSLHRAALSSFGWIPNMFFWHQIIIKTTKLFRSCVG